MAYYKRRYRKRRGRRYRKKRSHPLRSLRPSTGQLTCFQKYSKIINIPSQTAATGSFESGSITFSLNTLAGQNLGNFTRLFKWWRIKGVKVTFTPQYIGVGQTNDPMPAALCNGNIMTAITLDSNQLPPTTPDWTSVQQAEESGNLRKRFLNMQTGGRAAHVVKFKPRLNQWVRVDPSTQNSVSTLGKSGAWVSTGTPGTTYQGLRFAYETNNPHPSFNIEVRVQVLLDFKGVI